MDLEEKSPVSVKTPYGTVEMEIGQLAGKEIVFLSRHGNHHVIPPHLVNYRANLWALSDLGVKKVLATAAVGSLSSQFHLGDLVLLDQFLDFTKNRPQTFFEGGPRGVCHVDMTEPYCGELRSVVAKAAAEIDLSIKNGANYVCTEGPRFETPAEIRMFQQLGGDLVGMTSVPEVVLARELGMCYASIAMVTNEAAGISGHPLTHREVLESMKSLSRAVASLIGQSIRHLEPERSCLCAMANTESGMF